MILDRNKIENFGIVFFFKSIINLNDKLSAKIISKFEYFGVQICFDHFHVFFSENFKFMVREIFLNMFIKE